MRDSMRPGSAGDFFAGIVLLLVAGFVLYQSFLIYADARVSLAVSPALLPFFLGGCLLLCSSMLLVRTAGGQAVGILVHSIGAHVKHWFQSRETDSFRILGGIALLGAYVFVLIPLFEFWLSSSLFLFSLMVFLRAASLVKIGVLTAGAVGGIILLFQVLFNVSLP
jgi:hypothetical protein